MAVLDTTVLNADVHTWHRETCKRYIGDEWCTADGGYGGGWRDSWGTFDTWAYAGRGAHEACCACGGGNQSVASPVVVGDFPLLPVVFRVTYQCNPQLSDIDGTVIPWPQLWVGGTDELHPYPSSTTPGIEVTTVQTPGLPLQGTFRLGIFGAYTLDIPVKNAESAIAAELRALLDGIVVRVTSRGAWGSSNDVSYDITFTGAGDADLPALQVDASGVYGDNASAAVTTVMHGVVGSLLQSPIPLELLETSAPREAIVAAQVNGVTAVCSAPEGCGFAYVQSATVPMWWRLAMCSPLTARGWTAGRPTSASGTPLAPWPRRRRSASSARWDPWLPARTTSRWC